MMTPITPDLHIHWLEDGGCLFRAGDTQVVLTSVEVEKLRRIVNSAPVPAEAEGAPV
jgi:hypothetical protein